MKQKLLILLFLSLIAIIPGFANFEARHHSDCHKDSCKVGVQKPKKIESSIMEFIFVDLMTKVTRKDVERVFRAVKEQIDEDFSPIWGVGAKITLLPRGKIPTITSNRRIIGYLTDSLANSDHFNAIAEHQIVQAPPNEADGPQPQFFIPEVPLLPIGTPYILIPYGDLSYGLFAGINTPTGQIHRPGVSILDMFGMALGHEVMETLGDVFAGLAFLGAYQILNPGRTQTFAYFREVCDPVSWGTFNFYKRRGIQLQNFVTPDYFNPYAASDTCLDFLGNVKAPFTPFGGVQFGYIINRCGNFEELELVSENTDPTNVQTNTFPVYSCTEN